MPIRINLPDTCGLGLALSVIGGRWKSVILWELHERPLRFGELRRRLAGISEKVLYEQLREMECDGVVRREAFEEAVLRVEYSLTPAGTALNDAAHVLAGWDLAHAGRGRLSAAAE
jgi:DNA-binding HxlR family transcriptional regulator